jgi:simple sugar transport system permease protein
MAEIALAEAALAETARTRRLNLRRIEGLPIIVVFLALLALFMYTAPEVFLSPYIYTTFLSTLPPLVLLATGLTFVIGAGEIDLSFPAVITFSGYVFAVLFKEYQLSWIAVIAAVISGVVVGYVNGLIIARLEIPSFIATLGTQFFWSGMATVLSGGRSYALRGAEDSSVHLILVGRVSGLPPVLNEVSVQALWTALIVVALWFVLNRHRFGEHVLFIGDSNDVARVVGIDVAREKIRLFALMGALAAIAAIFLTLENKNYFGNQGQGYLLTAIASVLIGGTSIFGARATVIGSVVGCFIIGMIEAGLVASGMTGAWVRTVQGLVFLIAIIFYLFVDEPARRKALLARFRRPQEPPPSPPLQAVESSMNDALPLAGEGREGAGRGRTADHKADI